MMTIFNGQTLFRLGVIAAISATLGFVLMTQLVLAQQPSHAPTYTATVIEKQYDKVGRLVAEPAEFRVARRSDGSTVRTRMVKNPLGNLVEQKRIVDLTHGKEITVEGVTESLTTVRLPAGAAESLRRRPLPCDTGAFPKDETILGYDVVRVVKNLPGPPAWKTHRVEEWLAPDLDCLVLKSITFRSEADSPDNYPSRIVREVVALDSGDPAKELFEAPVTFSERSPSEVRAEMGRRYPQLGIAPSPIFEQKDQVYEARRAGLLAK